MAKRSEKINDLDSLFSGFTSSLANAEKDASSVKPRPERAEGAKEEQEAEGIAAGGMDEYSPEEPLTPEKEKKPTKKSKDASRAGSPVLDDMFSPMKAGEEKVHFTITLDAGVIDNVEAIMKKYDIKSRSLVINKILKTFFLEHSVK